MFFDIFSVLCEQKGVSRYKACTDVGLNRAAVAKWKVGAIPNGTTLTKLAEYFGVTTDYLIGIPVEAQMVATEYRIRDMKAELADAEGIERVAIKQTIEALEESYTHLQSIVAYENTPALTEKDERDIAKDLERIMAQLDAGGNLMFDGDPMSDEARESIKSAMKLGLEAAKLKNKERFTPKQYRKE